MILFRNIACFWGIKNNWHFVHLISTYQTWLAFPRMTWAFCQDVCETVVQEIFEISTDTLAHFYPPQPVLFCDFVNWFWLDPQFVWLTISQIKTLIKTPSIVDAKYFHPGGEWTRDSLTHSKVVKVTNSTIGHQKVTVWITWIVIFSWWNLVLLHFLVVYSWTKSAGRTGGYSLCTTQHKPGRSLFLTLAKWKGSCAGCCWNLQICIGNLDLPPTQYQSPPGWLHL